MKYRQYRYFETRNDAETFRGFLIGWGFKSVVISPVSDINGDRFKVSYLAKT